MKLRTITSPLVVLISIAILGAAIYCPQILRVVIGQKEDMSWLWTVCVNVDAVFIYGLLFFRARKSRKGPTTITATLLEATLSFVVAEATVALFMGLFYWPSLVAASLEGSQKMVLLGLNTIWIPLVMWGLLRWTKE